MSRAANCCVNEEGKWSQQVEGVGSGVSSGENTKRKEDGGRDRGGEKQASHQMRLIKVGLRENQGLLWKNQYCSLCDTGVTATSGIWAIVF